MFERSKGPPRQKKMLPGFKPSCHDLTDQRMGQAAQTKDAAAFQRGPTCLECLGMQSGNFPPQAEIDRRAKHRPGTEHCHELRGMGRVLDELFQQRLDRDRHEAFRRWPPVPAFAIRPQKALPFQGARELQHEERVAARTGGHVRECVRRHVLQLLNQQRTAFHLCERLQPVA